MTIETLLSLATAFGLGGVITQVVSGATERRKARADARRAMLVVERLRWRHDDDEAWRAAVRDLIATCLTARVPRKVTDRYVLAVRASRAVAVDCNERGSTLIMDLGVSDYMQDVGVFVIDLLWDPWATRLPPRRKRLKDLDARKRTLISEGSDPERRQEGHRGSYLAHRYWDQ